MATSVIEENLNNNVNYITAKDIAIILSKYNGADEENVENDYSVNVASNKMLGFLAEYLKVKVRLKNKKVVHFFVKAISRTNVAKAAMVKEMNLFEKEMFFNSEVKKILEVPGIEPWSPRLITLLDDAMVFEDLNAIQYKLKNKFERFDMAHTLQALKALARFHASSIVVEENKKKETKGPYRINDDYEYVFRNGGYHMASDWYIQCMVGALEAMKVYSKYDKTGINFVQSQWRNIWSNAVELSDFVPKEMNVICHRDLWNNNIMFHYSNDYKNEDGNELTPDNCVFVDFQAVRYQPPASDVMVLLCCNLEPKFRQENIHIFLEFYYEELQKILGNCDVEINDLMTKIQFMNSAKEQTKWGLVVCACLMPQFWIDDDLTTKIFSDNVQFDEILSKNKGLFIKKMMANNIDYKKKVMEIFEELLLIDTVLISVELPDCIKKIKLKIVMSKSTT